MNRMLKAVVASLCLVLALAPAAFAQPALTDLQRASDEAIRREAWTVELHKKLADAQAAQKRGDTFEAGRLDDAETNLNRSIKLDPMNKAAFYYLDLIREQRHRQENLVREEKAKDWMLEVDRGWRGDNGKRDLLPQPNSYARTNLYQR